MRSLKCIRLNCSINIAGNFQKTERAFFFFNESDLTCITSAATEACLEVLTIS